MRPRAAVLVLPFVAACSHGAPTAPEDPTLLGADAFCRLILEAPKRQLEARCTPAEKADTEVARLEAIASRPVPACVAALAPGVAAGRVKLHRPAAEACARALEAAPWKSSLRTRDLGARAECKGLSTGAQGEGGACRTSLECGDGLWCAGASFESDGACHKRGGAGATCEAPLLYLFDETSASCAAGQACDFGPFRPAYALGYPPVLSAQVERENAKRRAAAVADESPLGSDPLADRGSLAVLGVLGSGDARGEGIGLGTIGRGTGFGADRGRLGGSHKAPQLRVGAASVSGRLPPEVIQRIVRQNFGRFRLCYENGLTKNPNLQGRVAVRFTIARDGSVANAVGSGDLPDAGVVSCVARAFVGLAFPEPEGGIVTVNYPILFSPGDQAPAPNAGPAAATPSASATPSAAASAAAGPASPPEARTGEPLACVAAVARGGACAASHQCEGGLLCRAGHCDAAGAAGDACGADVECAEGQYCGASDGAGDVRGVCKPLEPAGAACTDSGECSGACGADGKCIALCGAG